MPAAPAGPFARKVTVNASKLPEGNVPTSGPITLIRLPEVNEQAGPGDGLQVGVVPPVNGDPGARPIAVTVTFELKVRPSVAPATSGKASPWTVMVNELPCTTWVALGTTVTDAAQPAEEA